MCGGSGGRLKTIHEAVGATHPFVIQSCYNMLNPSSGLSVPDNFPFQNFKDLINRAEEAQIGVVAIRVLAAGALSGVSERHRVAMPSVGPIGSGKDYAQDVALAQAFDFLVQEGVVDSLVEASIRFAVTNAKLSTALVGFSSFEQLEQAVAYSNKGALPKDALERMKAIWAGWSE